MARTAINDGDAGSVVRAALNTMTGELYSPITPYIAGRWYPSAPFISASGAAAASGTLRLLLFAIRQPMTVSELAARVTTTGSGSFQLGIYANDPVTMRPTGACLAKTGDILSTSAALVSGDITGADVLLPAGLYWAGVNVDASSAAAVFNTATGGNAAMVALIGATTLAAVNASSGNVMLNLTAPMAYNSWDDITAATFTEVSTGVPAYIFLKAA